MFYVNLDLKLVCVVEQSYQRILKTACFPIQTAVNSQEKEFTGRMEKTLWDIVFSEVMFEMLPGQLLQGKEAL